MPSSQLDRIQADELALAAAHALALANTAAGAHGVSVERSLVTITQQAEPSGRLWHVHYGPRDYTPRRGGDLTVVVDEALDTVRQVLRGQ